MLILLKQLAKLRLREISDMRSRIAGVIFSTAALLLLLARNWLGAVRGMVTQTDPVRYESVLLSVFASIVVTWVALGLFANFHFGWHFDLAKAFRAPVRPVRVFLAKSVCGLLGPWLLAVFPVLAVLAWMAAGPLMALPLLLASALLAVCANSATVLGALLLGRLAGRLVRMVFVFCCCLVFSLLVLGSIRGMVMHDHGVLTRFGRFAAGLHFGWVKYVPAAQPLAGLFRAAREHNVQAAGLAAGVLAGWTLGLLALEYLLLRRAYLLGQPLFGAPKQKSGSPFLSAVAAIHRWVPGPARPAAVILVREIQKLREVPSVPMLTLMFLCYCPVFAIFIPPENVVMLEMICTLPFLVFTGSKSNLFGPDSGAARLLFAHPAGLERVLRLKNTALDLAVGAIVGATALAGAVVGGIRLPWWQTFTGVCFVAAMFQIWDVLGAYCSVVFPQPAERGKQSQADMGAGQLLMILGPAAVLVVFAVPQLAGLKSGHPEIAVAASPALCVFAAGFNRILFRPWLKARLTGSRESLYLALARPGAV